MTMEGSVSSVTGSLYRVNISGSLSTPIPRLTSACRIKVSLPDSLEQIPPQIGDHVLCWFPGDALRDGYIVGIVEE